MTWNDWRNGRLTKQRSDRRAVIVLLGFERPLSSLMSTVFIIRPIPDNLVDIYSFIVIYVVSYIFGLHVCRAVCLFVCVLYVRYFEQCKSDCDET